jgi:putative alpha-1,2-mannosidase
LDPKQYAAVEDMAGMMGQYVHGNEPSHHLAYLYDYAGAPWRTQERLRQIVDSQYRPTPDGLVGNDDLGQMSAW